MSSTTTLNDSRILNHDVKLRRSSLEAPPTHRPSPPPVPRRSSSSSKAAQLTTIPVIPQISPRVQEKETVRRQPSPELADTARRLLPTDVSPDTSLEKPATADVIDMDTFGQILEMDDDDHDFSKSIIETYFGQAGSTFVEMATALETRDLKKLSSLGHFLKGSSAALGVRKMQISCERMQHYGQLRDEERRIDLSEENALAKIKALVDTLKVDYAEAEQCLKAFYGGEL